MRYNGYFGKVELDPEARLLHGEVLGLRDVVTFQADSAADIEKAFHESVDDYLAFREARGEAPEKPCSGQFVLRVGNNLHRRLTALAQASGKGLNAFAADCLRSAVEGGVDSGDVRRRVRSPRQKRDQP